MTTLRQAIQGFVGLGSAGYSTSRTGTRQFKVDPVRESNLLRNQAQASMYALALAKPEQYKILRADLEQKLTFELTDLLYNKLYMALNEGLDTDGSALVDLSDTQFDPYLQRNVDFQGKPRLIPFMREEEINKIVFDIASALISKIQSDVVDQMMPVDLKNLANERIAQRTSVKIASGTLAK